MMRQHLVRSKAFLSHPNWIRWGLPLLVLAAALLPRILALDVFLTADEDDQLVFASRFLQMALQRDWAGALVLGYPGVPTMALGALGLWLDYQFSLVNWPQLLNFGGTPTPVQAAVNPASEQVHKIFIPFIAETPPTLEMSLATVLQDPLNFIQAVRLPMVIAASLTIVLIYLFLRQLVNGRLALLATVLIAFEPIFLANSRIIHVDAPLSYFMFASFLAFLIYLDKGHIGWLIGSGLLGGLAVLSKTPAMLLGPILIGGGALYLLFSPDRQERQVRFKRFGLALLGWGLVAALAFVALWPSMWAKPTEALTRIFGDVWGALNTPHPSSGQFWGQLVTDQSPWYYLIAFPFHLTPLTSIGLIAGLVLATLGLRDRWQGKQTFAADHLPLLLALAAYVILFLIPVSVVARRGVRYLLPIFLAFDVLAAVGLWGAFRLLKGAWGQGAMATVVAVQVVSVLSFHPYYFDYFNPLLGGAKTAQNYVLVGWGEGLDQAAAYLNAKPDAPEQTVAAWYSWQFGHYFVGDSIDLASNEPAYQADYTVFYINQRQRGFPSQELLDYFAERVPEKVINVGGIDYAWIYPGPIIGPDLPDSPSHLLNVPFQDTLMLASMDLPETQSTDQLPVTLFWQTLQPVPGDFNISIRMVDEQGLVWGRVDRLPIGGLIRTDKWLPGQTIRDDYLVQIEPGTPPGGYSFDVLMYDFETGEIYGQAERLGYVTLLESSEPVDLMAAKTHIPHLAEAALANYLDLIGYDFETTTLKPGQQQTIKLYWWLEQTMKQDQSFELLARHESGLELPLLEAAVGPDGYGTSQWLPKQILADVKTIAFPLDAPPGRYNLLLDGDQNGDQNKAAPFGEITLLEQPRLFEIPAEEAAHLTPFEAQLGPDIHLSGYRLDHTQDRLDLTLYWQASQTPPEDQTAFIHVVDQDGNIVAQQDRIPVDGDRPTTTWFPAEYIIDRYQLPVSPGEYSIWVGMYDPLTWDRLTAASQSGAVSDNRIHLTTFQMPGQ